MEIRWYNNDKHSLNNIRSDDFEKWYLHTAFGEKQLSVGTKAEKGVIKGMDILGFIFLILKLIF